VADDHDCAIARQVALVQACTSLPIMLLSLPAGAAADVFDRRIVMLVAQVLMLTVSIALAVTSALGIIGPSLLLTLTFLLACGTAFNGPAWQSAVGDQVPRADISAAVSLNALNFSIARSLGPAIGGLLVASSGPHAAFIVNALSYTVLILVLLTWRNPRPASDLPPERMSSAVMTGLRYARRSAPIRLVVLRVPSSACWPVPCGPCCRSLLVICSAADLSSTGSSLVLSGLAPF